LASALGAGFSGALTATFAAGLATTFATAFATGLATGFAMLLAATLATGLGVGFAGLTAGWAAFDEDLAGTGAFFFCTFLALGAGALAAGRAFGAAFAAFTGDEDFLAGALWVGGVGFLPFFAAGACFEIGEEDFLVVIPGRIQAFVVSFPWGLQRKRQRSANMWKGLEEVKELFSEIKVFISGRPTRKCT